MSETTTPTAAAGTPGKTGRGPLDPRDLKGGTFRVLVGDHIDDGPPGCDCLDCHKSGGKNHRYRARRYGPPQDAGPPDPEGYSGDTFASRTDLELLHNFGPYSRKFERVKDGVGPGAPAQPPPPFPLDRMSYQQLVAAAAEEEIDLRGVTDRKKVVEMIEAARAGKPVPQDRPGGGQAVRK